MRKLNLVLLLIGLVLFVALIIFGDFGKVISNLSKLGPSVLVISFVFSLITLLVRAFKFQLLVNKKYKIDFHQLFPVFLYGLSLGNISPGRAAEPARAILLKLANRVPLTFSFACLFFERLGDMLVLLFFAVFAFYFVDATIFSFPFLAFLIVTVSIIILSQIPAMHAPILRLSDRILKALKQQKYQKFTRFFFGEIKLSSSFLAILLLAAIALMSDVFSAYVVLDALGANIDLLKLSSFYALSLLVGLVSFLPGGLGATEACLVILLGTEGIPAASVLTTWLVLRSFLLLFIIAGLLSPLFMRGHARKVKLKLK